MPFYDFKCDKCHKVSEHKTSIATRTLDCTCGGTMNRLMAKNIRLTMNGTPVPYIPRPEHISDEEILDA